MYTLFFTYPQRKKSQGVRSGDRGSHLKKTTSSGPAPPIHHQGTASFSHSCISWNNLGEHSLVAKLSVWIHLLREEQILDHIKVWNTFSLVFSWKRMVCKLFVPRLHRKHWAFGNPFRTAVLHVDSLYPKRGPCHWRENLISCCTPFCFAFWWSWCVSHF